jgi:ATP-dependent DNA helicase RecQ
MTSARGRTCIASPAELGVLAAGARGERQVESALRILEEHRVIRVAGREPGSPHIRLVVSEQRIRTLLRNSAAKDDLKFLQALHLHLGPDGYTGVNIEPRALKQLAGAYAFDRLARLDAMKLVSFRPRPDRLILERLGSWPAGRLPLDWQAVAERRNREHRRLERMQAYVYCRGCRRGFVLRYFGDPDAMSRCTSCDNCLGRQHALLPDAVPPRGRHPIDTGRELIQRFRQSRT